MESLESHTSHLKFSTKTNTAYYTNEVKGNGKSYLVSRSCFQYNHGIGQISFFETFFHLAIAQHLNGLSKRKQEGFINLLYYTSKLTEDILSYTQSNRPIPMHLTTIPLDMEDVWHQFTKEKDSIYMNLPSPPIEVYERHACVHIRDAVEEVMALDLPFALYTSMEEVECTDKYVTLEYGDIRYSKCMNEI